MNLPRARLAILAALAVSVGCAGDKGVAGVLVVGVVEVTPDATGVTLGRTVSLVATPKTTSGVVVPGRAVTWSSLNPNIASVSAGVVTGNALGGPVTIRATVDGIDGDAQITVNAVPVDHVTVTPPNNPLSAGASMQLIAKAFDANNAPLSGRSFQWQSGDPNVAAVTTTGMVLALNPGGPVTITATSEGKQGSATVTVTARPANRLGFVQQPTTTIAGAPFNPVIKVAVQDNLLATVTSATNPVTIALAANPGNATLSGTTRVNAVNGIATFTNLTLNKVGTGYTLLVTSGSLASAISSSFNIVAGGAGALAIRTAPPATAQSGIALTTQPGIQVVDGSGNDVHQAGVVVLASLASGTGTLGGTVTATTNASGTATFGTLAISGLAGSYALGFNATSITGVTSGPITLIAGAPAQLAVVIQPSSTAQNGFPLARQPKVQVQDAAGNNVALSGRVVVASIASGSGTVGGATSATTDGSGLAAFASLAINGGAGTYTLRFTAPALAPAVSGQVTLGAGAPTQIKMVVQPSPTAQVGVPFAQQPSVQLRDVSNNPVAVPGVSITVSASVGGNVLGTTTALTSSTGLAAFTGLALSGPASDYTLTFSSSGLDPATSNPITLSAGAATQLHLTTQPSPTAGNGVALVPQPVVQLEDVAGNPVATGGIPVVAAIGSGPVGGILGGTLSVTTNSSGAAAFTNLKISGPAGSYTLRFSSTGLTAAISNGIGVGAGAPTTIVAVSALSQSTVAGTSVASPPSVKVTDASSSPVANVAVTFTVTAGGGSTAPAQVAMVNTDAAGVASLTSWTVGTAAGASNNALTATAGALGPVTFTSSVTAAAANQVAAASVTSQSAQVSTAVGAPPRVKVTDQFANPVSGFAVSFAVTAGGGTVVPAAPTTVLTDAAGIAASTSWTLGPSLGANTVTATATGLAGSPIAFSATGTAGSATNIAAVSVTTQSAVAGTAVPAGSRPSVKVTDGGGNPVQGVVVTFAVTAPVGPGAGSISGPAGVATDAAGIATVGGWTLGTTAGTNNNTLTASAGSLIGSPVIFTASGTAGPAATITALSSTSQTATVGSTVTPPSVKVTDINGNAVGAGFGVTFTLTQAGGTAGNAGSITPANVATVNTDASGVASLTTWTLGNTAGTNNNVVTASGVGTPVTFNASGTAGAPASFAANSVTTQSANAGTAAIPPSISVTDSHGNPVQGVSVTFTLTTGGSIVPASPAVITTNSSGIATLTSWTLDNTAGNANSITASGAGAGSPVTFTATGTVGPAANMVANSPTSQSGTVFTTVVAPVVRVTDAHGNNVTGFSVTFTLAQNGTNGRAISPISPATVVTDVAGNAALSSWTLGKDAGSNNNTVTASGIGTPITFVSSAVAGAAANIAANSITTQSATVATSVGAPPSVLVTDQFGNPVFNATVIFTVVQAATGGLVDGASASTLHTNAAGIIGVSSWTLGQIAGTDNNQLNVTSPGVSAGSPVIFKASGQAGPASQMVFTTPPPGAASDGVALSPQPIVQVLDAFGNPVAGASVTVSIASGPGTLSGTVTVVTDPTGNATYTNLSISGPGNSTLKFSTSGAPDLISGIVTVT